MINFTLLGRTCAATAVLVLAGCVTASVPQRPGDQARCDLERFQKLLWRPEAALSEVNLNGVRVIRPNTAVTMDHRPNRTNLVIGKSGRIEQVYCG